MKIFKVTFDSSSSQGVDTVVCTYAVELKDCLEARGFRGVDIIEYREINPQQVRVKDLTVGDLMTLMREVKYENQNSKC